MGHDSREKEPEVDQLWLGIWLLMAEIFKYGVFKSQNKVLDPRWTQEDMGERGFGPRWYQRFESGKHIFTVPTLDRLARVFKVDMTDLFK